MLDVIIALCPALLAAAWMFGVRAIVLCAVSSATCAFFEWAYRKLLHKSREVGDLSSIVTGMLLSFCLPVTVPLWIPVVGALFAIVLVKQLFGGIGKNFMNPALAARAFLFSWPVIMSNWIMPMSHSSFLDFSLTDAVSTATPMSLLHAGTLPSVSFELKAVISGYVGGSMGEISSIALIVGGLYLLWRRVISCRIPCAYLLTVAVVTFAFPRGGNDRLDWMLWNLFSGGLMLGAIFMATDYVTSPVTPKGQLIFGIGCGLLTVFIRYFGSYPEGVSYAILVMNACVWLIDKLGTPKRFGTTKPKGGAA
jgi:electron transport complex protein RnfD